MENQLARPEELFVPAGTGRPRLAFLGVGHIGLKRMVAIADSGYAEIAAIADPSSEMVERATALAPSAKMGAGMDDLLAMDGIDGLVIATPSAQHATQAIAGLERGLAVFCQKPLGRDAAEVRTILQTAARANRLLGVDLSYRHTEAMQKIRALVQGGDLGEIFAVDLIFHNAFGPQQRWFYTPQESGGGCVIDLGIHLVDAAFWVLDAKMSGVRSRLYHAGQRIAGRAEMCEDYATAQLDLATGAVVNLACSWNLHAGRDAVIEAVFYGTDGGAALRNVNGSFVDFRGERFTRTRNDVLCEPPDAWGGRAAVEWARQLAISPRYTAEVEAILEVTEALDSIYAAA